MVDANQLHHFFSVYLEKAEKILKNQEGILDTLKAIENSTGSSLGGEYISEPDAKIAFKRGTTWFWDQRKNHGLPSLQIGSTHWYRRADIIAHFSKSSKSE